MSEDIQGSHDLNGLVDFEHYAKSMSSDELIALVNGMENYEEVSTALNELSLRDKTAVMSPCYKIVVENLGDEYLQAIAYNLLYESDRDSALEAAKLSIADAQASLLGAVMDNLSTDSLQEYAKSFPESLFKALLTRYAQLCDVDKVRIRESKEWFEDSYKGRL